MMRVYLEPASRGRDYTTCIMILVGSWKSEVRNKTRKLEVGYWKSEFGS